MIKENIITKIITNLSWQETLCIFYSFKYFLQIFFSILYQKICKMLREKKNRSGTGDFLWIFKDIFLTEHLQITASIICHV